MDKADLARALNEQLLKSWEIYISFFTVFLTVNITALGVVLTKMRPSTSRAVVALVFVCQNLIAVITGYKMYRYTADVTSSLSAISQHLGHFKSLGIYGGLGNAAGHLVIGGAWAYVIIASLLKRPNWEAAPIGPLDGLDSD